MSRGELEALQARVKELELAQVEDAQLDAVALQLSREVELFERALEQAEVRAVRDEDSGVAGRVMAFGFALLVVTPIAVMVGVSFARRIAHESALAVALLISGLVVVSLGSSGRVRRVVARRFSPAWAQARDARLLSLSLRSGERAGVRGPDE